MPASTSVRDVMTSEVITVSPDTTVEAAADLLAEHGFGAVPVVDASEQLVGLLRDEDLLVSEARLHVPTAISFLGAEFVLPGDMHRFKEELEKAAAGTVVDVMTTSYPTVRPDDSLEDVATLMWGHDVSHVPVLDAQDHVAGIVARGDVVKFLARTT
ncbi:MAG: CBS domain-containing protein [Acidimicrobiia bacterium]